MGNEIVSDKELFIIAGELSGDLIGSMLVKQLRLHAPELKITAMGGKGIEAAGADLRFNMLKDLSVVGFVEVLAKFPKIRRVFNDTVTYLQEHRPDVLVLIDYPGFNLRIAEQAHALGIKVVYYVCPQVWAWHQNRIHKLREYVDRALVILPFEEAFLKNGGMKDVHFVGSPWLDLMVVTMTRDEVFDHFGLDRKKKLIGLLPGSRRKEIDALLPIMFEAAEKLLAIDPDIQFVLPRATTVKPEIIDRMLSQTDAPVKIIDSFRYNVRHALDLAIVASGTATLETGLLGCPMVIAYKVAYLSWLIGKNLIKIPHIGLINIVAGDMVVPELLQDQCTPQNIADHCHRLLNDPLEIERIKYQLAKVREKMGGPGASERAAHAILELIS